MTTTQDHFKPQVNSTSGCGDIPSEQGSHDPSCALLIVNFGVSYPEARSRSIDALLARVQYAYPKHKVVMAFTSEMIRAKLKKQGEDIFNTSEALQHLYERGYRRVVIQPTHLMAGSEFHKMYKMIQSWRSYFDQVEVGDPLLMHHDDYQRVARILNDAYPVTDASTSVVLMGHGSEHPSNACYPALNFECEQAGFPHIVVGTVEGYPELDDVCTILKRRGSSSIILAPLLFVAGDHAQNDMASDDEDSWKTTLISRGYEVDVRLQGLGEIPAIQEMYLDHLKAAFQRL